MADPSRRPANRSSSGLVGTSIGPSCARSSASGVRHSIAEERRDIDGLIATLSPDCVYEIVPTGQRWDGHAGAPSFYTEPFAAFPDKAFELTDIVVGPQGVMEVATLTATNLGPWAGVAATGCRSPSR